MARRRHLDRLTRPQNGLAIKPGRPRLFQCKGHSKKTKLCRIDTYLSLVIEWRAGLTEPGKLFLQLYNYIHSAVMVAYAALRLRVFAFERNRSYFTGGFRSFHIPSTAASTFGSSRSFRPCDTVHRSNHELPNSPIMFSGVLYASSDCASSIGTNL